MSMEPVQVQLPIGIYADVDKGIRHEDFRSLDVPSPLEIPLQEDILGAEG